ncbi:hypothetical protein [Ruegeria arenilitoris]|uniref:hypothetical protein n=1 Tax=Ruegeria arenilitoris TaxID=1173585 RepID=UPI003463FFA2
MGLQVGGVDHRSLLFIVFGSQTGHHPGEDAFVAPPLPTVIGRLFVGDTPKGHRAISTYCD